MTSFVLIDYENVQPKNVSRLNGGRYKVKVFLGAKQAKVAVDMVSALQALGPDVQYVQIAGDGKNALDFHIAYYIGRLAAETPGADDPEAGSIKKRLEAILADLARRKSARPSTMKTLRSTINALFQKQLAAEELDALVDRLTKAGTIKVADGKVHYALPA